MTQAWNQLLPLLEAQNERLKAMEERIASVEVDFTTTYEALTALIQRQTERMTEIETGFDSSLTSLSTRLNDL